MDTYSYPINMYIIKTYYNQIILQEYNCVILRRLTTKLYTVTFLMIFLYFVKKNPHIYTRMYIIAVQNIYYGSNVMSFWQIMLIKAMESVNSHEKKQFTYYTAIIYSITSFSSIQISLLIHINAFVLKLIENLNLLLLVKREYHGSSLLIIVCGS